MKKFCKVLFLFLIFPLTIVLVDLISPLNAFTFRQWEALRYSNTYLTDGYFYPLQTITMDEVGDLGRHTPYEVRKHTTWKTDELGFRNEKYVINPDILLIGDSFFAGASLTQDSTIGSLLQNKVDSTYQNHLHKVYNISINGFNKFENLLNAKKIYKPKIIIFSIAERSINSLPDFHPSEKITAKQAFRNRIINWLPYQVSVYSDRLAKQSFLRYLSEKFRHIELNNNFWKKTSPKEEKGMLFRDSANLKMYRQTIVSNSSIHALLTYQNYCNEMGIKFIFVPIPDKETLYYEKVSPAIPQSTFLVKLDSLLHKNNVLSINLFSLFNERKKMDPATILYQYDDTHWNGNAVNILADELIKMCKHLR